MSQCILKMGKIAPITLQVNMFIHQTLGYSNIESYFMINDICLFGVFTPIDILLEQWYTNDNTVRIFQYSRHFSNTISYNPVIYMPGSILCPYHR